MTPPAQFARQTIRLQFPKDIHWGDDMTVWIAKTGDIARTMYLRVTWPTDAPTTVQPSAGTAMIDRVELSYKDQLIERIYGENLYMLGDTRVPQAKQAALTYMVGTGQTSNLASYHIPMPFSILKKGLPLIALDEAPKFRVVFKPSTFFTNGLAYTKPIQVDLFVEYVYVTKAERDYLTSHELIYTTESFQRMQFRVPSLSTQSSVQFLTSFVNDVKELYWVIQGDNASNVYDYGTTDQLVNLQLTLNSIDRITPDYATAQYLRVIQGLEFHTRVPNGRYYMYSFALEPELNEPSGEINMTNINRQQHTLTLTSSASARSVRIYALSYNLFSVSKGNGVSLYTLQEGGTEILSIVNSPSPSPLPDAVTGFVASNPTETTVDLIWNPALYATSYSIETSPPSTTQTTSGTTLTFPDLVPDTEYTFTITPSNATGNGPPTTSDPISTLLPLPDAVTGFVASNPTETTVDLIWNPALYATSYSIETSPPSTTQTTSGTTLTFPDLVPDTEYTFTITPSNATGNGPPTTSDPISTLPLPLPGFGPTAGYPDPPNVTATTIDVVWFEYVPEYATSFNVYAYSVLDGLIGFENVSISSFSYTYTGLTPGTEYYFTVAGVNATGVGEAGGASVNAYTLI
jgi:hypothetical protein